MIADHIAELDAENRDAVERLTTALFEIERKLASAREQQRAAKRDARGRAS